MASKYIKGKHLRLVDKIIDEGVVRTLYSFPIKCCNKLGERLLGKLDAYYPNIARVFGSSQDELFILWQPGTKMTLSGCRLRLMG